MKNLFFILLVLGCLASAFLLVDCLLGGKSAIQQAAQAGMAIVVVLIPHALMQGVAALGGNKNVPVQNIPITARALNE